MEVPSPTSRFTFRHFREDDVDALFKIFGDPEVMRFSVQGPAPKSKLPRWLALRIEDYAAGRPSQYAVIDRETEILLGFCGLLPFKDPDGETEYEIGFRYRPSCWNQGIGTEAALGTLKFVFKSFEVPTIVAVVERENIGSVRLLEKIGMRYVRDTLYHEIPVMRYQLSREEFQQ